MKTLLRTSAALAILGLPACETGPIRWHEEDGYRWAELRDQQGRGGGLAPIALGTWAGVLGDSTFDATGVTVGDFDGDGRPDLFVGNRSGPDVLLQNQGRLDFDLTLESAIRVPERATTASLLLDLDGDMDPDLLLGTESGEWVALSNDSLGFSVVPAWGGSGPTGEPVQTLFGTDLDGDDRLDLILGSSIVLGLGDGLFNPVTLPSGGPSQSENPGAVETPARVSVLRPVDVDGDGDPDLLEVEAGPGPGSTWLNDGFGGFSRAPGETSAAFVSGQLKGADFSDVDRDGRTDVLLVAESGRLGLWVGEDRGGYTEATRAAGVPAAVVGTSVRFADLDLDGWDDVLMGVQQEPDAPGGSGRVLMLRGTGPGTFGPAPGEWGDLASNGSRAMTVADLDGDGDSEVVIIRRGARPIVLQNRSEAGRLVVRLRGSDQNTQGLGARVQLDGPGFLRSAVAVASADQGSGRTPIMSLAVPAGPATLTIDWRDGSRSVIEGVRAGRIYEVEQSGAQPLDTASARPVRALFQDASVQFAEESVSSGSDSGPRGASWGPGLAWADIDVDGDPDLLVGGELGGGTEGLWRNGRGTFAREALTRGAGDLDRASILPFPAGERGVSFALAQNSLLRGEPQASILMVDVRRREEWVQEPAPGGVGALAAADVDEDGDLDLLAVGRPHLGSSDASPSRIYLSSEDGWTVDSRSEVVLASLGTISAAVFTDVDGDGDPDLAVAVEGGDPAILLNSGGSFQDGTIEWGLDVGRSRWNGVSAADFDTDGRVDLVFTSWGRNAEGSSPDDVSELSDHIVFLNRGGRFEARSLPFRAQLVPAFAPVVADFDGNGTEDLFLGQNYFPADSLARPYQEGRGLVLLGVGNGDFRVLSGSESGLRLEGGQRGAATADFDRDGRPDVAVVESPGGVRLLRNQTGRPGLLVTLRGPRVNPWGVGAKLRVTYTDGSRGPIREVHLGGGYGSADSPVQILGLGARPSHLEVDWPGGRRSTVRVGGPGGVSVAWSDGVDVPTVAADSIGQEEAGGRDE